jgi:hypothetical protein
VRKKADFADQGVDVRVSTRSSDSRCVQPELAELATPFCFGEATDAQRDAFELHLMECDACWQAVQRLEQAVGMLRADMTLAHTLTTKDIASVLGMSAALDRPFGGHARHAVTAAVMYALLYALPLLVEVAYAWNLYGRTALIVAPFVFVWMFATTLGALAVCVRDARADVRGFVRPLFLLIGASAVFCAVLVPLAPSAAVTQASFQTWPANLAFLKSTFHAWLVAPVFILWPFHFVLVMQRQLALGRYERVVKLLTRDSYAVPPPGVRYPAVWALGLYFAGLVTYNWLALSHLFDHLAAGPYKNLFMALVLARVAIWLALPVICIWWYQGALDELKRESVVVTSLCGDDDRAR